MQKRHKLETIHDLVVGQNIIVQSVRNNNKFLQVKLEYKEKLTSCYLLRLAHASFKYGSSIDIFVSRNLLNHGYLQQRYRYFYKYKQTKKWQAEFQLQRLNILLEHK